MLGREGFTAGRHFWEVTVGGEGDWAVGVARKSVRRKGEFGLSPEAFLPDCLQKGFHITEFPDSAGQPRKKSHRILRHLFLLRPDVEKKKSDPKIHPIRGVPGGSGTRTTPLFLPPPLTQK